jgi:hypothetical protein
MIDPTSAADWEAFALRRLADAFGSSSGSSERLASRRWDARPCSFIAGYRGLYQDDAGDGFRWDVWMHGPRATLRYDDKASGSGRRPSPEIRSRGMEPQSRPWVDTRVGGSHLTAPHLCEQRASWNGGAVTPISVSLVNYCAAE